MGGSVAPRHRTTPWTSFTTSGGCSSILRKAPRQQQESRMPGFPHTSKWCYLFLVHTASLLPGGQGKKIQPGPPVDKDGPKKTKGKRTCQLLLEIPKGRVIGIDPGKVNLVYGVEVLPGGEKKRIGCPVSTTTMPQAWRGTPRCKTA
jgi:hypothetical protein